MGRPRLPPICIASTLALLMGVASEPPDPRAEAPGATPRRDAAPVDAPSAEPPCPDGGAAACAPPRAAS